MEPFFMTQKILIDFEKIIDPFSGLGQVCAHLKIFFDKSPQDIHYWQPTKFQKLARHFPFLLPKCDLFHAVHQDSPYYPWSAKTKYLLTIHDLNALKEKTQFKKGEEYKKNLQKKIDRAFKVTFISEFTRQEVLSEFKLDPKNTQVIYNGISLTNISEAPKIKPQLPFFFSVGTVLPKKNFHVLIDLLKIMPDFEMVIAGTTFHSYAQDMKQKIIELGLEGRIHLVGTISEREKLWYYQNAKAFIFPSLLEGFGLPVAEAMSLGLPLFLSDKTSLPEIGGRDACYFKHFEPEYMKKIINDELATFSIEKKNQLINRSQIFSWKKAADEFLKLYE